MNEFATAMAVHHFLRPIERGLALKHGVSVDLRSLLGAPEYTSPKDGEWVESHVSKSTNLHIAVCSTKLPDEFCLEFETMMCSEDVALHGPASET